jgi:16S rRNA (uracil1498-N3)-methyltransferase
MWYISVMRLHRFYVKTPITEDTFDIKDKELVHQWRDVFRYNVGSQIVLFDGSGQDFLCIITSLRALGGTVSVLEKKENIKSYLKNIWLCMAIIKKDNFELVVEKATELGVMHIVPILCERSEKKSLNMERLEKIGIEASEQSGRGQKIEIHEITDLQTILKNKSLPENKIVLHPEGEYIGDFLSDKNSKDLVVFIGPEGGFSEAEIEGFTSHCIPTISLGSQILRSETAAIAVASLLLL